MIYRCPNCGDYLTKPIEHGLKSCAKCKCFFESNKKSQLLSAAWEIRKSNYQIGFEEFKFRTSLIGDEANFVYQLVSEDQYSHDEIFKAIDKALS